MASGVECQRDRGLSQGGINRIKARIVEGDSRARVGPGERGAQPEASDPAHLGHRRVGVLQGQRADARETLAAVSSALAVVSPP